MALGAALLLVLPPWNPAMPRGGIDPSWMFVLNHALVHGWQWGVDVVYTSGPLAFLTTRVHHPQLWPWVIAFWCVAAIAIAGALHDATREARPLARMIAMMGTAVMCLAIGLMDAPLFALPLLTLYSLRAADGAAGRWTWILVVLSAIASLSKLTVMPLALILMALGDIVRLRHRRAPIMLPLLLTCMAGAYLATGQSPHHLLAFLDTSLSVSAGYGDAMQSFNARWELALIIAGLALLLVTQGMSLRAMPRFGEAARWLGLAAWCFMTFKAALVRHDVVHVPIAWTGIALAATLLLGNAMTLRSKFWQTALSGAALIATVAMFFSLAGANRISVAEAIQRWAVDRAGAALRGFATFAIDPGGYIAALDRAHDQALAAMRAAMPLPPLTGTTDIIASNQTAIVAHGFDYRPRPTIQEYTTYTAGLIALNHAFYEGPRAPAHVVFGPLDPIDGRLPSLTEAALWPALLTHYEPYRFAGRVLILSRRAQARPIVRGPATAMNVAPGDVVDLPRDTAPLWMTADLRRSVLGQLVNFLFKLPPLFVELTMADGARVRHRLIPAMARQGFVISPYVADDRTVAALWFAIAPSPDRVVQQVRFTMSDWQRWLYRDDIAVHIEALRFEPDHSALGDDIRAMLDSARHLAAMAPTLSPVLNNAGLHTGQPGLATVLLVHAPARATLATPPAAMIEIGFGLGHASWPITDGACFALNVIDDGPPREFWRRCLDPTRVAAERGEQHATISLPPGPWRRIEFVTECAGSCDADWAYWSRAMPRERRPGDPN